MFESPMMVKILMSGADADADVMVEPEAVDVMTEIKSVQLFNDSMQMFVRADFYLNVGD